MWGRLLIGVGSLGLYGWRVHDPKGSYAAFFDASDWLTSWIIASDGAAGYLKSFANIILVDQADGFLLGMAFMAMLSIVFWPFRKAGRWVASRVRGLRRRREELLGGDRHQPDNIREPTIRRHRRQPAIHAGSR